MASRPVRHDLSWILHRETGEGDHAKHGGGAATPHRLAAAVLGLANGLMRLLTGSLWPPILFHGTLVALWQSLFAAPDFATLIARP